MNIDRLWAPWRLEYVTGDEPQEAPPGPLSWLPNADQAVFYAALRPNTTRAHSADRQLLVVTRGTSAIVVLNRYPYNNGHLLVSPLRHVGDLKDLTREENSECMDLLSKLRWFIASG